MILSAFIRSCLALSLLLLLACGGGGGGDSPAPPATSPNISMSRSVDFGGNLLNTSSGQVFTIRNTGTANLSIRQISNSGLPFSVPVANDFCSNKTLSPSQTCAVTILFSPAAQGSFAGRLTVPSNDPDADGAVTLAGVGYGLNVWVNEVSTSDCLSFVAEATVTDPSNPDPDSPNNVLLRGLNDGHFTLNGGFSITAISNTPPAPVSVVLALDSSESLLAIMPQVKSAAQSLINYLGDEDEAAIFKFYGSIDSYPATAFTATNAAGKTALSSYIALPYSGEYTRLYDTIMLSIERASVGTAGNRKAVILISDGVDYTSTTTTTVDAVIAYAVAKGIPVFTIYNVDPAYQGGTYGNTQVMQRLALETGGQYFYSDAANLSNVIKQIASTLSNKYTITFTSATPTCTGTFDARVDWNSLYGRGTKLFP